MYGKVTRYFQDRGYGFILGEDRKTYFIHRSNLDGEHIGKGYYVHFSPYQNDRSDYNAREVIVIDAPEMGVETGASSNKKKKHRRHKSCNADRIEVDDRRFSIFVKTFFEEQEEMRGAVQASDDRQLKLKMKNRRT